MLSSLAMLLEGDEQFNGFGSSSSVIGPVVGYLCRDQRNGKVTVSLKSRVAGVERSPAKVADEPATLARNEGALLGGDTVVAEGTVTEGREGFGVYRCAR